MNNVEYKTDTFPTSEKFRVFRVFNSHIWQIITQRAYYLDDDLEWDYFDFIFDDPVTAEILCGYLNEAEVELNG